MKWKCYRVQAGKTLPCPQVEKVVEGLSPGSALEFYLATHGLLGYNHAFVEETDQEPSPGFERTDFVTLFGARILDAERLAEASDQHHDWLPFP